MKKILLISLALLLLTGCFDSNEKEEQNSQIPEHDKNWCKKGDIFYMKPDSTKLLVYSVRSDGTFNGYCYGKDKLLINNGIHKYEVFGKYEY